MLVFHASREGKHLVDRVGEPVGVEELRANMRVVPGQVNAFGRGEQLDRALRLPPGDRQPKLGVDHARADLPVRMYVDARVQPQQHRDRPTHVAAQLAQHLDLVEVVDDDLADPGLDRHPELVDALVVAM